MAIKEMGAVKTPQTGEEGLTPLPRGLAMEPGQFYWWQQ